MQLRFDLSGGNSTDRSVRRFGAIDIEPTTDAHPSPWPCRGGLRFFFFAAPRALRLWLRRSPRAFYRTDCDVGITDLIYFGSSGLRIEEELEADRDDFVCVSPEPAR